jgi:flavin reductase (DIM6/NTAB) family NADH-FMN oxidoreductase RutF
VTRRELDPVELGPGKTYPWLTSLVLPRPIAWVGSTSPEGVDNLAPHSFFTVASSEPPILQFTSVGHKDTLRNVEATGEFTVSLATYELREQINATGTDFPAGTSEFDACGVERAASVVVRPPRVAASPAAFECVLEGTRSFGHCTVVFGRVVHLSVDESVIREGRPRVEEIHPVARLGGAEWAAIGDVFRLRRVPYAERTENEETHG